MWHSLNPLRLTKSGTSKIDSISGILTLKIHTTIKPGDNRITAKYECANNPDSKGFSSVSVTGTNQ